MPDVIPVPDVPDVPDGHSPPSLAKILSGPPVPLVIFIGRANTVAPWRVTCPYWPRSHIQGCFP